MSKPSLLILYFLPRSPVSVAGLSDLCSHK